MNSDFSFADGGWDSSIESEPRRVMRRQGRIQMLSYKKKIDAKTQFFGQEINRASLNVRGEGSRSPSTDFTPPIKKKKPAANGKGTTKYVLGGKVMWCDVAGTRFYSVRGYDLMSAQSTNTTKRNLKVWQ